MAWVGIAAAVALAYCFRKRLTAPWAVYISHSALHREVVDYDRLISFASSGPLPKKREYTDYFVTVRHTGWLPPFSDRDETYHRKATRYMSADPWVNIRTGVYALKQDDLSGMISAALAREIETEELIK